MQVNAYSIRLPLAGCHRVADRLVQASCFNEPDIYTVSTEVTAEGEVVPNHASIRVERHRQKRSRPLGPECAWKPRSRFRPPRSTDQTPTHLCNLQRRRRTAGTHGGSDHLQVHRRQLGGGCRAAGRKGTMLSCSGIPVAILQYSHSATIYTNDPAQPIVSSKSKATSRYCCDANLTNWSFPRVTLGETPSASTDHLFANVERVAADSNGHPASRRGRIRSKRSHRGRT